MAITEEIDIQMLEKLADGNFKKKNPETKASQVKFEDGSTVESHKAEKVQHLSYAIATGTNSYAVNIPGMTALVEGMSVKINFTSANTGACTLNINSLGAIPVKKSNGNDLSAGNIKAGQICHLVYTGSAFQLLGEGGEYGTAQAQDVLKGKTIGTEEGIKTGTMPNNGAISKTITTQGGQIIIPKGYHSGSGIVKAQFANLIADNIRNNVDIGGVMGKLVPHNAPLKKYSVGGLGNSKVPSYYTWVVLCTVPDIFFELPIVYFKVYRSETTYEEYWYTGNTIITSNKSGDLHGEVKYSDGDISFRSYLYDDYSISYEVYTWQ